MTNIDLHSNPSTLGKIMTKYKVISGGQTGADQGGLYAAHDLGIPTGGWAPRGYRTEIGSNYDLEKLFGLKATLDLDYRKRTKLNVTESDGTLIFGNAKSSGSRLTHRLTMENHKPCFNFPRSDIQIVSVETLIDFINEYSIKIINVAGNRESSSPGIGKFTYHIMTVLLKELLVEEENS